LILKYLDLFSKCYYCKNPMFPHAINPDGKTLLLVCPNNCQQPVSRPIENLPQDVFFKICDNLNSGMSPYENVCYACGADIIGNDLTLKRDAIRSLGYKCPNPTCGKSLRDKLIRDRKIFAFNFSQPFPTPPTTPLYIHQ
jgi:hypothetical protein